MSRFSYPDTIYRTSLAAKIRNVQSYWRSNSLQIFPSQVWSVSLVFTCMGKSISCKILMIKHCTVSEVIRSPVWTFLYIKNESYADAVIYGKNVRLGWTIIVLYIWYFILFILYKYSLYSISVLKLCLWQIKIHWDYGDISIKIFLLFKRLLLWDFSF